MHKSVIRERARNSVIEIVIIKAIFSCGIVYKKSFRCRGVDDEL